MPTYVSITGATKTNKDKIIITVMAPAINMTKVYTPQTLNYGDVESNTTNLMTAFACSFEVAEAMAYFLQAQLWNYTSSIRTRVNLVFP